MKKLASVGILAVALVGTIGISSYALTRSAADTPECCQKKESCCPGSQCCPKGEHAPGAHCAMHS